MIVTLDGQTLTPAAVAQYLGGNFPDPRRVLRARTVPDRQTYLRSAPNNSSLVLDLPAVNESGNYTLSNLRFVVNGNDVLDLSPNSVVVNVIDQVLVTSVQTQALTLAQIQAMGVVLNSSDYTGFNFTIGLQLSSQVVNISFPVVFNPQGVAIPQPISATGDSDSVGRECAGDHRADLAQGLLRRGRWTTVTTAASWRRRGFDSQRAGDSRAMSAT